MYPILGLSHSAENSQSAGKCRSAEKSHSAEKIPNTNLGFFKCIGVVSCFGLTVPNSVIMPEAPILRLHVSTQEPRSGLHLTRASAPCGSRIAIAHRKTWWPHNFRLISSIAHYLGHYSRIYFYRNCDGCAASAVIVQQVSSILCKSVKEFTSLEEVIQRHSTFLENSLWSVLSTTRQGTSQRTRRLIFWLVPP